MTAPMTLVHEGCGTGHITVGGTNDDLRNALISLQSSSALSSAELLQRQLRALGFLDQLELAADEPQPLECAARLQRLHASGGLQPAAGGVGGQLQARFALAAHVPQRVQLRQRASGRRVEAFPLQRCSSRRDSRLKVRCCVGERESE